MTLPQAPARPRSAAHPLRYAASKLGGSRGILSYWRGPVGDSIRAIAPRIAPGVPPVAWMGMVANNGPQDDTAAAARAALAAGRRPTDAGFPRHAKFSELGWPGITGGRWDLAAPNTDTSTENNWYRLHDHEVVKAALGGREASMESWQDPSDQAAIGILAIVLHGRSVAAARALAAVAPRDEASLWFFACAFGGWSAGSGRLARHLAPHARAILAAPPARRWEAAVRAVAAGPRGDAADHDNPAYTILRTAQKVESARALALADPGQAAAAAWLATGGADMAEVYDRLVWAAGIGDPGGFPGAPSPSESGPPGASTPARLVVAGGVAVGLLAAAIVLWPYPDPQPAAGPAF